MAKTTVVLALFSDSTFEDLIFEVEYTPQGSLQEGPLNFLIEAVQTSGPSVNINHFPEIYNAIQSSVRAHYFRNLLH